MNRFFIYFVIVLKLLKYINIFGCILVFEYLRMFLINFYICILGNWLLRIVKMNFIYNSFIEIIVLDLGFSNYVGIKFEVLIFLYVLYIICVF